MRSCEVDSSLDRIFGALCALVAVGLGAGLEVGVLLGAAGFVAAFSVFPVVGMRSAVGQQARAESRFPTPDDLAG